MKTKNTLLLTAILPLLAPLGSAQDEAVNPSVTADQTNADARSASLPWRASDIIGTNVKNAQDETIGEVKDLVVELDSEEVIAVVISTGGFLGIGENLSPVSLSALRYDSEEKVFRTTMTRDELEKEPRYTSRNWPGFDKERTGSDRAGSRVGSDETDPDNTARNKRDRDENSITPMDQGNSESDLQMTRNIRSSIMDSDLSFNAKNIKIVTKNGHVTLRGVVQSHKEHEAILRLVRNHADASIITDQLAVKNK
jgi:hyperosmotically inducible periplasmic protein